MAVAGPVVARSATGQLLAMGAPGADGKQGPPGIPGPPGEDGDGYTPVIVNGPATITVTPSQTVYIDLSAGGTGGGDVTVNTAGFGPVSGTTFASKVRLIDPTGSGYPGSHKCSIHPMSGGKIEKGDGSASLTTSNLVLTQPGQGVTLESPDGVNLWAN
jgi:hypothetical protein